MVWHPPPLLQVAASHPCWASWGLPAGFGCQDSLPCSAGDVGSSEAALRNDSRWNGAGGVEHPSPSPACGSGEALKSCPSWGALGSACPAQPPCVR